MASLRDQIKAIIDFRTPNPDSDFFALIGSFALTSAEIAAGVMPTNFTYSADPYVDPRRYGADPTGSVDSTVAVQKAINVAYQCKGAVWIGNNCNFLVGALSLTMTGNHTNDGIQIIGSSVSGSALTQNGSPTALLTFNGSTPTGNPQESPILLDSFSIHCSGNTTDGVLLNGVGGCCIRNINIGFANAAIHLTSALIIAVEDCDIYSSLYGIAARTNGTGAPPNFIQIRNSIINGCNFYAVDYDTGSLLIMDGNDIEANGTPATCTANPAITATSATLTAVWPLVSGVYPCTFPDGEARNITFTNNATAISWTGGLAATQSAPWIATPTGAVHIGASINASVGFGFGQVWLENNWFEANRGGWSVQVDAPTAGQLTDIAIKGGFIIASANGLALRVGGAGHLFLENLFSLSPGDTWQITATYGNLQNVSMNILTDNLVYPTYINVTTGTGHFPCGRVDNFTATLTGCTTSPTGNIAVRQQGDQIDLDLFTTIAATSNTTAATLTGLPSKYWPQADTIGQLMIQDNSANSIRPALTAAATGIITLGFGQTLTNVGTKGVVGGQIRLRKA